MQTQEYLTTSHTTCRQTALYVWRAHAVRKMEEHGMGGGSLLWPSHTAGDFGCLVLF